MRLPRLLLTLASLAVADSAAAQDSPRDVEARTIFAELIGINTTLEHGNTTPAAEALARRFHEAGFPDSDIAVIGPEAVNKNFVVRFRGTGARPPILLLAHLDVVEARPEDWSLEPFTLTEREGYFYGRGTSDIKDMAAIYAAVLLELKRDGFVPDRDIILALTAGEESTGYNGVDWLLTEHRALIEAAYCINGDGGDPLSHDGRVFSRGVQASEKVYTDFQLEVRNAGGHSSLPIADNAIYRLSAALERLSRYRFPARLNEVTQGYFERAAASQSADVAADMRRVARRADPAAIDRLSAASPYFNAMLRTTCVATRLAGGHANNALPQLAQAVVNCRLLPDERPEEVLATLHRVAADTAVHITVIAPTKPSPPSPLVPEVMRPVERLSAEFWPGSAVVPSMETGATDGLYLRSAGIPVYGISGVALDADDNRSHGRDERIRVTAFYRGLAFSEQLVRALAGAGGPSAGD